MFTKTQFCEVHMIVHRIVQITDECREATQDDKDLFMRFMSAIDALEKLERSLESYRPPFVREVESRELLAKMARSGELDFLDATKAVKP